MLRKKLIKIDAKVVRHGRYVTFQLAEVAIPRRLFADILRLIDGLRPKPAPSTAAAGQALRFRAQLQSGAGQMVRLPKKDRLKAPTCPLNPVQILRESFGSGA